MKAIVGRKFDLDETCFKVVKQLGRVLTIPSEILHISNELPLLFGFDYKEIPFLAFFLLLCPFFLTFVLQNFMMCTHSKRCWASEKR
jgi:hypothetical protein